ncbi:MAG: redoxin domain-containing protein [Rubricoccaceae bacterium]
MSLRAGDSAPDFTLFDSEQKPFTLSDASGPVVLLFFPGAFTSVCTDELNLVGNDYASYQERGAEVVGISTDSPFALAEFKKVHGFPFRLLSDHDGDVSAAYGSKYDNDFTAMNLDRISRRSAFVVGANGTVLSAEVLESAGDHPDFDRVRNALDAA